MIVRKVHETSLRLAAQETGLELVDMRPEGSGYRFRLGLGPSKRYQRLGFTRTSRGNRRHISAVCWHGYRDFMRAMFRMEPDAVVRSQMATYRGTEDFVVKFEDTGHQNVGSMMEPVAYRTLCDCSEVSPLQRRMRDAKPEGVESYWIS